MYNKYLIKKLGNNPKVGVEVKPFEYSGLRFIQAEYILIKREPFWDFIIMIVPKFGNYRQI
jgi:hypothetical protein